MERVRSLPSAPLALGQRQVPLAAGPLDPSSAGRVGPQERPFLPDAGLVGTRAYLGMVKLPLLILLE